MNRGSGRRTVFANDDERRLFLGLLAEAGECTGVETHAYCLMGNHFHLLLRSADGSLSEAMKQLSSGYTRRVNTWRGVDGSIFRGRFNSVLVEEVEHLRQLCRYIHRNPVEAGLVGSARQYRWSSCRALIGDRRPPAFLHTATVLGWFGDRPEQFLAFVDDPEVPDPEFVPVDHDLRVGDHSGVGGAASVPGLDHLERWVEVEFGCDPGHLVPDPAQQVARGGATQGSGTQYGQAAFASRARCRTRGVAARSQCAGPVRRRSSCTPRQCRGKRRAARIGLQDRCRCR